MGRSSGSTGRCAWPRSNARICAHPGACVHHAGAWAHHFSSATQHGICIPGRTIISSPERCPPDRSSLHDVPVRIEPGICFRAANLTEGAVMDMRDMQPDVDPQETREWLEALDSVLEREGPARANYLLEKLVEKARQSGAYIP